MTPEQHNKYLAYSHIGYGAFFMVLMLAMVIFIGAVLSFDPSTPGLLVFFLCTFLMLFYGAMTVPSFVAGYGLLKRKKWAKVWSIIAGVVSAMNFPFGTAVCVYTFWFLFSDPGKFMYEQNNYALPPGRQTWANQNWDYEVQRQREGQYTPPPPPPDWR